VRQRIEAVFISWYTGYWTQQWIAVKVSWYQLQQDEGEPAPEEREASYLQEQFSAQVPEPLSSFVDPHTVMQDATVSYLRELKGALDPLPVRYHIPATAFKVPLSPFVLDPPALFRARRLLCAVPPGLPRGVSLRTLRHMAGICRAKDGEPGPPCEERKV